MAKTMGHLSDFAFLTMYNLSPVRRDSYLAHVKAGIKQDTLAALRQAPMDLDMLFPDTVLKKAEEDISKFEDRGQSRTSSSNHKDNGFHPYKRSDYQENKPIIIIMYLYSGQYLHILQDSNRYLTNPTVQVQPQVTSN